jgi:superfamily II DNA/RNA helicase
VLAKSPTGSGKTLAFAVPIVERGGNGKPFALVLVPTRELCVQVTEELAMVAGGSLQAVSVYGGVPLKAQARAAKTADVIVATPGRLQDLVDRRLVSLDDVRILVLDEADRMLDMGFKPQVDKLVRHLSDNRQTMFFSATLDGEVGELARRYTHFPARFEGELPAERRSGDVDHKFVPVTPLNKVETLVKLLESEERGLALVFVRTKAGADRLVEKLRRHQVDAVAIHGDKGQAQRQRALQRFDAGKVRTLVATDVAARGLDVDDITHVINFDPPEEPAAYTHRVGRTGRAGRGGVGITLVLPDQQADVSRVARLQGHVDRFEESGMTVAKPRLVYSSRRRGGRSKW